MTLIKNCQPLGETTLDPASPLIQTRVSARTTTFQFPSLAQLKLNIKNIITISTLIYFLLIPIGVVKKDNRFGPTEAAILTIVLLFSSNMVEKVKQFRLGTNGLEFTIDNMQNNIEANRSASQKESAALSFLGTLINNDEDRKKFFDTLLNDGELKTLENLFKAEKTNKKLLYDKEKQEELEQQLRHLRSLNFIESKTELPISSMPSKGDLRVYFKLSEWGNLCLALGSSKVISEEIKIDSQCREVA